MNQQNKETREKAIAFLRAHNLMVIATINSKNTPEAATMHYWLDENANLYFITRKHTRKFKNLSTNPRIAIVVGTTMGLQTLQIEGIASPLSNEDARSLMGADKIDKMISGMVSGVNDPLFLIKGLDLQIFKTEIRWARLMYFNVKIGDEVYEEFSMSSDEA